MKIGITGINGFIGKNLKNSIELSGQHTVEPFIGRVDEELSYHHINNDFFYSDLVVHLAGKNKGDDDEIIKANVIGTEKLLNLCLEKDKPIIVAGSDYKKDNSYKLSKDTVKHLCKSYSLLGLDVLILNLPKVFGPGCKPHYNSFVSTLIYLAAKGQLDRYLYLIKDPSESLDIIHINDVICTIENCINMGFEYYTEYSFTRLDGLITITLKEIVDILQGNTDHKYSKVFLDTLRWYKENNI